MEIGSFFKKNLYLIINKYTGYNFLLKFKKIFLYNIGAYNSFYDCFFVIYQGYFNNVISF